MLSSGHTVHFERLKPHIGSATEWVARNAEQDKGNGEIMFPEPQVMTDHPLPENEDMEEVSNEAETLPYMNKESNVSRNSEKDEPDTYLDRPTAVITRKNRKPYNPYGEDFLLGDQARSESQQETIPVSPDIEVDDNVSGDTFPYAAPTTKIKQPNVSKLREARIEEWLKKQDRNISHLLPEVFEEESERTSSAATKTIKDNPRQWKLSEGPLGGGGQNTKG